MNNLNNFSHKEGYGVSLANLLGWGTFLKCAFFFYEPISSPLISSRVVQSKIDFPYFTYASKSLFT